MRTIRKKNARCIRRSAWYWIRPAALSLILLTGAGASVPVVWGRPGLAPLQARPTFSFDIPTGPLQTVLEAFSRTTGLQVSIAREGLQDLISLGAKGSYSPDEALARILSGTGVAYRYVASNKIILDLGKLSESVDVTTEVLYPVPSSAKYTEDLRDIPQTITIIPRNVIEQQGATTLREVLTNVPGITMTAGEGGAPAGDNLTVRGFSARNDVFIDGVRDLGPQSRDSFNMEQVEVVKGPASAYTGRGSTGGSINLVSKSPNLDPFYSATMVLGTSDMTRITADVNTPVSVLGDGTALRLNIMANDSGVAGRSVVNNRRWGFAPSLAIGLGTLTRLTFSYFYAQQKNISDYGIPWVPATNNPLSAYRNRPAPVPRDTFYGLESRDVERMRSDLGTINFERDFTNRLSLRSQIRFGKSSRDSIASTPRFASPDTTVIAREMKSWITDDSVWDNQTNLRTSFGTGPIEHALSTGIALTRETNLRQLRTGPNMTTSLMNPNPQDVYLGPVSLNPNVGDVTGNTLAVYAFDTARLSSQWELTGGIRSERFDVNGVSTALAPVSRVDMMHSLRGGLVYKPKEAGSLYVSYGTSLNPSLEGLSYSVANTQIEPEKTYTFEVGSKWELAGGKLLLNGAAFRVEKTNARTAGLLPDDPPQILDGKQRASGIELGATGSITRAWKIFGAYTLLDARIVESNNVAEVGRRIQNAPRNSANIWTSYRLGKLDLGGGIRSVGRRYADTTNLRYADSYWTADAMASYAVSSRVDLRVNLYNLNNAYYFERLSGGHVVPGAARSIVLSTGVRF